MWVRTYAFYYLLSIYKSLLKRERFKMFYLKHEVRVYTRQDSNSEYEDWYWLMSLWRRLSRREPKYFKSEVSKTEMSKTEVSNAKYRKPKYRKSKYQKSKWRNAKGETRKSKRERRKSKLFLFSAQVHVGLRVEVRVSKSRSPKAFYLIARYLYLLKTKFENRNLGIRNAL